MNARRELREATALIRAYDSEPATGGGLLDESIARLRALADKVTDTDPVLPAILTNLSIALTRRSIDDLSEAVRHAERSVRLTRTDDEWYGSRVNNLGAALALRYESTSVIRDLERAVDAQQELLALGGVPAAHRALLINNLAQGLRVLWEVTADRRYLREAASRHREAVRLSRDAPEAPDHPMILAHAGITARHWRPGIRGCRAAIELCQEAVALTTPESGHYPDRVIGLAKSWLALAAHELPAASMAERQFDAALEALAIEDDARARAHWGRAEARERLGDLTGAMADYETALGLAQAVTPIAALSIADQAVALATRLGDDDLAVNLSLRGLGAMEAVIRAQVLRRDQRSWQRHAERLTTGAALTHLRRGEPAKAVQILDTTRSREMLLLATAAALDPDDPDPQVRDTRRAVRQWLDNGGPLSDIPLDRLGINDAEATPMGDRPGRSTAYLVAGESGGAVVVEHSNGLIEFSLLRRLTDGAVRRRRQRLLRAHDNQDVAAELDDCAHWLGRAVIGPMLELVRDTSQLVIVPAGPLAELPLLAARRGEHRLLLDRAPLFASNGRSANPTPGACTTGTAVAVLGSTSPVDVFGTAEAELLSSWFATRTVACGDPQLVMSALHGHSIVHFGAHGVGGRSDAVETAVMLPGGAALRASDILRTTLEGEPLVFLASCETGRPDPTLPDQTFGPPAAFLRAGASAVIAPILAVTRHAATIMSAAFYRELAAGVGAAHEALASAQAWLANASISDQLDLLDEAILRGDRADHPTPGLRALRATIANNHTRWPELTGDALWCYFEAHI